MASYQDLETRLNVLEDKVNFVMRSMRMARPSIIEGAPPTVLSFEDLYLASRQAGLEPAPAQETVNG